MAERELPWMALLRVLKGNPPLSRAPHLHK